MPLLRIVAPAVGLMGALALAVGLGVSAAPTGEARRRGSGPLRFADHVDVSVFQKGNLHTHTLASDGDSDPLTVAAWYQNHGYAFLAITDHNVYGDASTVGATDILVIPGEEITMMTPRGPVHVNALCHDDEIGGHLGMTVAGSLVWATARIHEKHGVVLVNHPNYHWVLKAADLAAVGAPALLEISSGHPAVHSAGNATHPSHEALWDAALSSGEDYVGVAVDDAHAFKQKKRKKKKKRSTPGQGWVQVFAPEARQDLVCGALREGRLYASSGAEIDRLVVEGDTMTVWPSAVGVVVDFIAQGGHVVESRKLDDLESARYRLHGDEGYVRARVTDADGHRAWTPAYRVAD